MNRDEIIRRLAGKIPDAMLRQALESSNATILLRDKYLAELEAEKGKTHRILASAVIKTFGVAVLMALFTAKLTKGLDDPELAMDKDELHLKAQSIMECVQQTINELAIDLEVPLEDYREISMVAMKMARTTVDGASGA